MKTSDRDRYDFLVIGAGVAGLRAAIELASMGASVAVLTKDDPQASSSGQARGGIAVALSGEEPDLVLHVEDTLAAGDDLCDEPAASTLVRDGRDEVLQLIEWGARFDREGDRYHLTREAAHSMPRILHAGGDATGREIVRALVSRVVREANVERRKGVTATDLLVADGRCVGARLIDLEGRPSRVFAGGVLLATGGLGCCYSVTSNPPEATGDGIALGLRAGCEVGDMEFVQFHPTSLAMRGAPPVLLTEALRGEGGLIVDERGERFLGHEDPRGELAPRDVVARGIARQIERQSGRPVGLDLSGLGKSHLARRFPGVVEVCLRYGIDPLSEPLPVRPAAHYAMGGIVTDLDGETGLPGLTAAGEVASCGVHGANRLASNSLLEGLVFGARAARALGRGACDPALLDAEEPSWCLGDPDRVEGLRALADSALGIVRRGEELARALHVLEDEVAGLSHRLPEPSRRRGAVEAASVATTLLVVARAAKWREESRGAHYREDFPRSDEEAFRCHSRQSLVGTVRSTPVVF